MTQQQNCKKLMNECDDIFVRNSNKNRKCVKAIN